MTTGLRDPNCQRCDGTGDIHRADGEWSGECDCTPPPAPPDYRDLGVQHFLIGLHTPDRMATSYPTHVEPGSDEERQFIAGWNEAKAEHDLLRSGDGVEWD